MQLTNSVLQAVLANAAVKTGQEFAVLATRKAVDAMQAEGQMLVQLVQQTAGVGQNINMTA
jgi:hypothetical protein